MSLKEYKHITAAVLILTIVASFSSLATGSFEILPIALAFSIIIISVHVISKKFLASSLDTNVEHELFTFQRFGLKPHWKFKSPLPAGIIFPLFFSIFSLGIVKLSTLLTYETRALKHRAARRFGLYSYTEITEFHNALIGAIGIFSLLLLSVISYLLPFTHTPYLAKLSIYYAFWNLLPYGRLDGSQIFMGSRPLYFTLAILTLVLTAFALAFTYVLP
tara:strand:- start:2252 stop:2908 length:657 start_codon:yes stop_codon:yes gene_type:complete